MSGGHFINNNFILFDLVLFKIVAGPYHLWNHITFHATNLQSMLGTRCIFYLQFLITYKIVKIIEPFSDFIWYLFYIELNSYYWYIYLILEIIKNQAHWLHIKYWQISADKYVQFWSNDKFHQMRILSHRTWTKLLLFEICNSQP